MANNVYSTYRNGLHLDDPQYLRVGIFGDLAKENNFIDEVSPYCEDIFLIESFDSMEEIVKAQGLQMVFGITNYSDMVSKKFKELRSKNPNLVIGFGIKNDNLSNISDIFSLECERYFADSGDISGLFWEFQKTREIALDRSISHYEAKMLEAILDAYSVSVADKDGTIFYVNNTFASATGYMPFELIGANHRIFKHPKNAPSIYKDLWKTIKSNKIWRGQIINMTREEEMIISDTTIVPYYDQRKKSTLYLALRQDIPVK
jgi:PAS domain S-box-containing protein